MHKETDYSVIDNGIFRDKDLSLAEVGLLCTVLSLPENWDFKVSGLQNILKESTPTIRRIIKSLIDHGYCKLERLVDDKTKKVTKWEYTFFEVKYGVGCGYKPQSNNPQVENPQSGVATSGNVSTIKYLNNKVLNKSNTKRGSAFAPPTRDQVREFFRERKFNSDPDAFWLHFENCNWKLSSGRGAKMKDWRLAAISWEKRENQFKR